MSQEIVAQTSKDSIGIEKTSRGYNFTAKAYINGSGDMEDTEEKLKARLDRYVQHLESTYGNKTTAPF